MVNINSPKVIVRGQVEAHITEELTLGEKYIVGARSMQVHAD